MVVSRVFPGLIRLNQALKLNKHANTQLLNSSRFSVLKHCPGALQIFQIKAMSTDMEKELNNPKRHFNYNQLVAKKKEKNVIIIDVREHSEINETGKMPGSIHIPLAELGKALGDMSQEEFRKQYSSEKPQKDAEIIFSCKAGGRSLKALKLGLELGYNKSGNYKGGWLDWAENTKLSK